MQRQRSPLLHISERRHPAALIRAASGGVHFEEHPAGIQNREKVSAGIKSVTAEHGLGAEFGQGRELIQHKLLKGMISHESGISALLGRTQFLGDFHQRRNLKRFANERGKAGLGIVFVKIFRVVAARKHRLHLRLDPP